MSQHALLSSLGCLFFVWMFVLCFTCSWGAVGGWGVSSLKHLLVECVSVFSDERLSMMIV